MSPINIMSVKEVFPVDAAPVFEGIGLLEKFLRRS